MREDYKELSCSSSEDPQDDHVDRENNRRYTEFNSKVDMSDPQFKVGMVSPTVDSLKQAIKEYVMKIHKGIRLEKNDNMRIRVVCQDGCPFFIYGSAMANTSLFLIKIFNE